jgi:excinuclease ABC subunit C
VPIPDEVLLPLPIEGEAALADWLGERRGRRVRLQVPRRGDRVELLALAARNAEEAWRERGSRREAREELLEELRRRLRLSRLPRRMECFDISTFHGKSTVGSMAVIVNGEPAPAEYRHFQLRTVAGTDDYAALREVVGRRLKRGLAEQSLPDFILIDGGRGQLGVLGALIEELGLASAIDAAGIAKSRVKSNVRGKVVERSEERLFLPGRSNPVTLPHGSPALFLLERLRDEAHRFAVTYHRKLRGRSQVASALTAIPGIGSQRRKALLQHFGSVARLRAASLEELKATPSLPGAIAEQLYRHFHGAVGADESGT